MSLVVELEKGRGVGMVVLQVKIVDFGFRRCVPAVFADIHLCKQWFAKGFVNCLHVLSYLRPPLLVVILVRHPVHF